MAPLAIHLFCGLGGWTEGLLAEGYDVIGFDIERHQYGDAQKSGRHWFADPDSISGSTSSKSHSRKAASAAIAKIPFVLASYIARTWKPVT